MRLPGFTEGSSLPQSSMTMARINVGGLSGLGLGVMRNPDCYCVDYIWVCDQWSCHGACIRWECP
jgi:hypothetical protein